MKTYKINFRSGKYASKIERTLRENIRQNLVKRIWDKDSTVWKSGKGYDGLIKDRLGWISLPSSMKSNCDEIISFTEEVRSKGFTYVVLLGMGGSSMCPEVCKETFGIADGYLRLFVLDSTDPMSVFDVENSVDIDNTLFIVASKSGGTIEVDSFFRYFFEEVKKRKGADAGKQFIAITDPQTMLEAKAKENNFRKIFINPPDIGGRYSALSYFGLVPASLIGIDIKKLLSRAEDMMDDCMTLDTGKNPGLLTGIFTGSLSRKDIDKLTFILSPEIESFGYWVEQLIAESTGKEGKGILPVEGEITGKAVDYGKDRIIVSIRTGKKGGMKNSKALLKKFPSISIELNDLYDIGGQFYLWEFATAVMGAVLGINPFDEPNVKESKDNTGNVLKYFEENKKLPEQKSNAEKDGLKIYYSKNLFKEKNKDESVNKAFKLFFKMAGKGDYFAVMAYIAKSQTSEKLLKKIREIVKERKKVATTVGYGPRFLHSTGQFHKGGPDKGIFLQIVSDDSKDLEIPDKPYSFSILKQAQATGDYESLLKHDRRVIKVNVGRDIEKGLTQLYKIIKKVI